MRRSDPSLVLRFLLTQYEMRQTVSPDSCRSISLVGCLLQTEASPERSLATVRQNVESDNCALQ
jgi:hypothetical protein